MKKSKAMKGLERDAENFETKAHEFDEHLRDDVDDFDHKMKADMGADMSKAKNKMDNAGRNMATHVEKAGTKAKNHFDNRKK